MYVATLYVHLGAGGIEVLVFQFAYFASVHGIGPFAAELCYIEQMGACAYLLVGVEGDANLPVLNLGVSHQIGHGGDYLGDARLVVGTQEGGSVGNDEVLAHMVFQFGELFYACCDARCLVQNDVCSVIVVDDTGFYVGSATVGARVHMGNKADGRDLSVGVGRQGGIDVCMLVHLHLLHAEGFELVLQIACQYILLLRTRAGSLVLFAGLCVKGHVL